jgi:hypothetical protein
LFLRRAPPRSPPPCLDAPARPHGPAAPSPHEPYRHLLPQPLASASAAQRIVSAPLSQLRPAPPAALASWDPLVNPAAHTADRKLRLLPGLCPAAEDPEEHQPEAERAAGGGGGAAAFAFAARQELRRGRLLDLRGRGRGADWVPAVVAEKLAWGCGPLAAGVRRELRALGPGAPRGVKWGLLFSRLAAAVAPSELLFGPGGEGEGEGGGAAGAAGAAAACEAVVQHLHSEWAARPAGEDGRRGRLRVAWHEAALHEAPAEGDTACWVVRLDTGKVGDAHALRY